MHLVTERGRNGTMKARAKNYLGIVVNGRPKHWDPLVKVKMTKSNPFYVSGHVGARINRDQVHSSLNNFKINYRNNINKLF